MALAIRIPQPAPAPKWQIQSPSNTGEVPGPVPIYSTLSTEEIRVPVYADSSGVPVNPSVYTVQFAFVIPPNVDPTVWYAGTWDTNAQNGYDAQCLIGPNGVTTLAAGSWFVWMQISASPETIIRQVGQIQLA